MTRRQLLLGAAPLFGSTPLEFKRSTIFRGRSGRVTYFQPRACAIPRGGTATRPRIFLTAAPVTGDDLFWNLHWSESADLGETWSEPKPLPGLKRVSHPGGISEELLVDANPEYHPNTGTVLLMGDNVFYAPDGQTQTRVPGLRWQQPVYMVRNKQGKWSAPRKLEWSDPRGAAMVNAGNSQRVMLPNGDILLAVSHAPEERYKDGPLGPRGGAGKEPYDRAVSVVRCSFDGAELRIRKTGSEFRLPVNRGLIEPSLTAYRDRFYLTLRAEDGHGYTSRSKDGLEWEPMRPWKWDDGEAIVTSTTQQHWLVFDDRLFLLYTRRAAENANVIRWRAPLYMAEVDAGKLCLVRATERVVLPLGPDARFGNFHAAAITPDLAIVHCTEETSKELHYRGDTLLVRITRTRPS